MSRLILVLLGLAVATPAWAGTEWFLETAVLTDRAAADRALSAAASVGKSARVVRRFKLGRGWEYVLLVEHLDTADAAQESALRLARALGVPVQVYRNDDGRVAVVSSASAASQVASGAPARGVADVIAKIEAAHGGRNGGAETLARAGAVHFKFARTVPVDGRVRTLEHDYWRANAGRRLEVSTNGAGVDSIAVATEKGAWLRANGAVVDRDAGVLVTTVDAFSPEAVLTLALDVPSLLRSPEVERFKPLEGAESGVRLGQGGDESERGLSFVDADPATGHLLRARYVTEAGPVTVEMSGWRAAAPGVIFPDTLIVERVNGQRETVRVQALEVVASAPSGTFSRP